MHNRTFILSTRLTPLTCHTQRLTSVHALAREVFRMRYMHEIDQRFGNA